MFDHAAWWQVVLANLVTGPGIQMSLAGSATLVIESVPGSDVGVATGINTIAWSVVGAIGAQIVATVLAAGAVAGSAVPSERAFELALGLLACALVVAGALALAVRRSGVRRPW